jgi:hypothetical protein
MISAAGTGEVSNPPTKRLVLSQGRGQKLHELQIKIVAQVIFIEESPANPHCVAGAGHLGIAARWGVKAP